MNSLLYALRHIQPFHTHEFLVCVGDNGKLVYSIIGGNENEQFRITQNGTIMTAKSLDRETQSLYNLVVMATDQAKPPEKRLSSTVQVISSNGSTVAPFFPSNTKLELKPIAFYLSIGDHHSQGRQ